MEFRGHLLIQSGHVWRLTALLLSSKMTPKMISWGSTPTPWAILNFTDGPGTILVASVYLLHSGKGWEENEQLLEEIGNLIRGKKTDFMALAGDWNTELGEFGESTNDVVGPGGRGPLSDRGLALANWMREHSLTAGKHENVRSPCP